MIKFDADYIRDMVATYIYDDIEGRNEKIYSALSYLYEKMEEVERCDFYNREVTKVLNSFQLCVDSDMVLEKQKAVRGVKSPDVAFIAAHYGFMFGLVWAENQRLKFYE